MLYCILRLKLGTNIVKKLIITNLIISQRRNFILAIKISKMFFMFSPMFFLFFFFSFLTEMKISFNNLIVDFSSNISSVTPVIFDNIIEEIDERKIENNSFCQQRGNSLILRISYAYSYKNKHLKIR